MQQRKSDLSDTKVLPGVFIPHRAILEKERKETRLRKQVLGTLSTFLLVGMGFGYISFSDRILAPTAGSTTPYMIVQDATAYKAVAATSSIVPTLSDRNEFQGIIAELTESNKSFVTLDVENKIISVYRNGLNVFEAPVQKTPRKQSWRYVPSGVYQVSNRSERQYSAVQEFYYSNSVQFSKNYVVHGTPEKADGRTVLNDETGIQLNNSDAKSFYDLVDNKMVVVVHSPEAEKESSAYINIGPSLSNGSYLVADISDGAVISYNGELKSPVPIASLTKIMTALVVAETYDIEGEVIVEQETYVDTLIPRLSGVYRTTHYNLLQLLMSESSNEAAEVLATVMGRDAFITKMNATAKRLGMKNTIFADPSGLADGNTSSLNDLLLLTTYIYEQQPFIWNLSMKPQVLTTERPDDFEELSNFNFVDGLDDVIGGKIGETTAAGQTSVTLHKMEIGGKERIVALILLGSASRTADVHFIHKYITQHF